MGDTSQLIQHIEKYADSSRSPTQQAAILDAIVFLLKQDAVTIGSLEMEMYLTTTDDILRARGQEAVIENAYIIIKCLIELVAYPHVRLVRETAIQCLVAMWELPCTRIYPVRIQVLKAISRALDDSKRAVHQEAVKCQQAWASIASRSLHY